MSRFADFLGTVESTFQIGLGSGLKRLRFRGGFSLDLEANPTANRTITLPDASGTLLTRALNVVDITSDYPLITPGGRLSLSASNSVADGTDATTLYYLPHEHNLIPLWDNTNGYWIYRRIPDAGITVNFSTNNPGVADIFASINGSSFVLGVQYWSSNTSRASDRQLVKKHGINQIQIGVAEENVRTYLGTVRTTGSTGAARLQDNATQRFVFNACNQVWKPLLKLESTSSWTYGSSTWRPMNGAVTNRVEVVDGLGTNLARLELKGRCANGMTAYGAIGLGLDTTTTNNAAYAVFAGNSTDTPNSATYEQALGLGYHYLQAVESIAGSGTVTFYGQSYLGLKGSWQC